MHPVTAQQLIELNRRFYLAFGGAFAATRRRLQPGAQRVIASLPLAGDWLDLGCGSGEVARHLAARGFTGSYTGLDFSPSLLEEACQGWPSPSGAFCPSFRLADLTAPDWAEPLAPAGFDVILCLAALHHLPGQELRLSLLRQARSLLKKGGVFIHSEWQFQNSPKLMARRLPWHTVGLDEAALDPGDTLLDWLYALPGQAEQRGLRYVHLFTAQELSLLAEAGGFVVEESFESDGHGGRLALYQRWRAA